MDDQGTTRKLQPQQQPIMANNNSPEMTLASEVFDQFCNANTLKSILGHFRQLCDLLKIKPNTINQFYPKLKAKLRSWKAQALWKKFDQRANHKCYNRGKACPNTRVLIIGGGPCGLRSAIEAQLLGVKVVVVEKRDRMSRNNVLHLWPFVIHDLRGLGAKKFFGKFCAGSIDHISIRQLQCILLKVALILGVEFHESVSFDSLIPPPENQEDGKIGWRAKTTPADHPVSQYEFDVLIGADGKRNTLEGFKRKEFRGKLAIAITANFINKRTEAEARVEEISGVAFIFNQKFFKELYQETGIDLENIVYYKDDTHYFVMTAKKHSLIDKGVILQDHADTAKLLAKENVDREALMLYAREAAEFSTEYQMMDMEFAVNHYGQPDVAMFDFTSMYAAENASRILERHGHKLLMILVGDSLLEPFWPTGSGCARGFLSSLDACWAIKGWGAMMPPLEVIAERESIYRLLGQTTPENLNRDYAAYTLDPHTRYPNLNVCSVTPIQVRSLLDTDDPESIKHTAEIDIPKKRRRRDIRGESHVHPDTLLRWLQKQVALYSNIKVEDMGTSFKDGLVICAIIHRYRPDLIDFHHLKGDNSAQNNQLGFDILEKEYGIPPVMTGEEMADCEVPDKLAMFSYLTQIYEVFRGEIPQVKYPQLESDEEERAGTTKQLSQLTAEQKVQLISRLARQDNLTRTRHSRSRHNENMNPLEKKGDTIGRRSRKRRSTEKMGATVVERQRKLAEIEKNRIERMKRRQYLQRMATQQFYKSMQMLQANAKREKDEPFEDYSIFLYRQTAPDFKDRVKYLEQKILYPDREPKIHVGHRRPSIDEEFSGRIKNIEDKLRGSVPDEKKPKDLLRAIGKIEKTDWNVKEIEKKIEESKVGRATRHDKVERVPKWSREQFLARQTKMERKGRDEKEADSKYADIDNTLKNIGKKIKEGNVLGHNKVSVMAEQFANKNHDAEPKLQKSNIKTTIALPAQGGSEMCHFCNKRVYLMERLTAEGKFFHRGCFRCEYCSTSLRIGNHTFDRERNGGRFYCTQHFGFSGTMKARAEKKRITAMSNKENISTSGMNVKTPEKIRTGGPLEGVVGLDILDRGQTPERIEFENLAGMSDPEEAQSQMDEDEWTDRNFGASTAEMGSSDDISNMSDSDDNEIYEEAIDQPLTTEGTLELAKNWTLRYSHSNAAAAQSDTGSNEYEDSSNEYTSEDDESGTATEDEEDIRARELRKQEVWLKQPTRSSDTDTGSETEVKISQDSLNKIIEKSIVIPELGSEGNPNLVSSPVARLDKSEAVAKENVTGTDPSNAKTFNIDALEAKAEQRIENNEKFIIEKIESRDESVICKSVIPVCPVSCDAVTIPVTNDPERVIENPPTVSSDHIPACDLLNKSEPNLSPMFNSLIEDIECLASSFDMKQDANKTINSQSKEVHCVSESGLNETHNVLSSQMIDNNSFCDLHNDSSGVSVQMDNRISDTVAELQTGLIDSYVAIEHENTHITLYPNSILDTNSVETNVCESINNLGLATDASSNVANLKTNVKQNQFDGSNITSSGTNAQCIKNENVFENAESCRPECRISNLKDSKIPFELPNQYCDTNIKLDIGTLEDNIEKDNTNFEENSNVEDVKATTELSNQNKETTNDVTMDNFEKNDKALDIANIKLSMELNGNNTASCSEANQESSNESFKADSMLNICMVEQCTIPRNEYLEKCNQTVANDLEAVTNNSSFGMSSSSPRTNNTINLVNPEKDKVETHIGDYKLGSQSPVCANLDMNFINSTEKESVSDLNIKSIAVNTDRDTQGKLENEVQSMDSTEFAMPISTDLVTINFDTFSSLCSRENEVASPTSSCSGISYHSVETFDTSTCTEKYADVQRSESDVAKNNEPEELPYVESNSKQNRRSLKLDLGKEHEQQVMYPVVTVTSASPIQEHNSNKISVESTKLMVPEQTAEPVQSSNVCTSFDKLKKDLRERKEKNRKSIGELRPLTAENAKQKIGKYFEQKKSEAPERQGHYKSINKNTVNEGPVKVVQLDVKSKLSNKISTKDIMKYFDKESPGKIAALNNGQRESACIVEESDRRYSVTDELTVADESHIRALNQKLHELELENEKTYLFIDKNAKRVEPNESARRNKTAEIANLANKNDKEMRKTDANDKKTLNKYEDDIIARAKGGTSNNKCTILKDRADSFSIKNVKIVEGNIGTEQVSTNRSDTVSTAGSCLRYDLPNIESVPIAPARKKTGANGTKRATINSDNSNKSLIKSNNTDINRMNIEQKESKGELPSQLSSSKSERPKKDGKCTIC